MVGCCRDASSSTADTPTSSKGATFGSSFYNLFFLFIIIKNTFIIPIVIIPSIILSAIPHNDNANTSYNTDNNNTTKRLKHTEIKRQHAHLQQ